MLGQSVKTIPEPPDLAEADHGHIQFAAVPDCAASDQAQTTGNSDHLKLGWGAPSVAKE
jgi:hypothetical protein